MAAATCACCRAHCGYEQSGAGLGGGLDFHPGRSQRLPPAQIPAHFLPLVVAAEVSGGREGSASKAMHVMGQSTEPPRQLPLQHCGHIQLQNVFAFSFQALAWACPALFHLRNSHSARVSEGPEFLCACSSFARSPVVPRMTFIICASLFLKTTY